MKLNETNKKFVLRWLLFCLGAVLFFIVFLIGEWVLDSKFWVLYFALACILSYLALTHSYFFPEENAK